ncbi:MAG: HNH endonuclease, partial [Pseudanabaena sp.]
GKSPSVQIGISAIHSALQNGLSFVTKDNDEIAIGVRPDQFLIY